MSPRQRRLLQPRVDEPHIAGALQVSTRPRDQLVTGVNRGHL
jgi:hypothetical protein